MKKMLSIIVASLITLNFTGCNIFKDAVKEFSDEISKKAEELEDSSENKSNNKTSANSKQTCTVGNVSFEVPSDWIEMSEYEGSFTSSDKKSAYQIQGESELGNFEPEEFYSNLCDTYSSTYNIVNKEKLSSIKTADDTSCFVGRIKMTGKNILFNIDVLIAPDKNTVITFASQCAEENEPDTDIREVTKTVSFNIGIEDMASGRKFTISQGTEIHLNDDGTFKYFETSGDPESSYFEGNYEVYYGQAAFDKLVSMKEYGLTEDELEHTLSANMNGYKIGGSRPMDYIEDSQNSSDEKFYRICRDTFYVIIMNTKTLTKDGNISYVDGTALYMGYYIPEIEQFDLLSVNTYTYTQWSEIK